MYETTKVCETMAESRRMPVIYIMVSFIRNLFCIIRANRDKAGF